MNKRGARIVGMIVLAITTAVVPGAAQEPEPASLADWTLEDLLAVKVESVVGAAKHEQRLTEAASSVSIITARDIRMFGWRTLADVLQGVRGFYVTYDRNYSYLGVRGFGRPTDYNNRVLITIDGHRVNDSIYDGALIGTEFPLDLALVDRIEVIRGPGSALYGTNAFFAVINVVTRRGAGLGGEAAIEAGSLDTYRGHALFGWGDARGHDVLVSATEQGSGGRDLLYFREFDSPETNGGRAVGVDGDRARSAYLAATLGRWRIQTLVGHRTKEVPTGAWGTLFNDGRFETTDQRGWVTATHTRPIGTATLSTGGYYDHYRYDGAYPFAMDEGVVIGEDSAHMHAVGGELSVRRRFRQRHLLTVGLENRNNLRQHQRYAEEGVATLDAGLSSTEVAVFVQDEIALAPRWTAVLGARYDWWSHRGSTGRPRLGLVYRTDYDTAVKVLYGEAYRVPTVYELYYYSPDLVAGEALSRRLRPESLRTTEVVFEQYLRGRLRVAATAYLTSIRDLIDSRPGSEDDQILFVNEESARAQGFELEAEGRWASGILVRGSYSLQDAHDSRDDQTLSNAPHHLAALQVSVPAWRRQLRFSSDTTYASWRTAVDGTRLGGYAVTNLTTLYEPLRSRLQIGASLYNLFDTSYVHPVGVEFLQPAIEQNGRTFALRATVTF